MAELEDDHKVLESLERLARALYGQPFHLGGIERSDDGTYAETTGDLAITIDLRTGEVTSIVNKVVDRKIRDLAREHSDKGVTASPLWSLPELLTRVRQLLEMIAGSVPADVRLGGRIFCDEDPFPVIHWQANPSARTEYACWQIRWTWRRHGVYVPYNAGAFLMALHESLGLVSFFNNCRVGETLKVDQRVDDIRAVTIASKLLECHSKRDPSFEWALNGAVMQDGVWWVEECWVRPNGMFDTTIPYGGVRGEPVGELVRLVWNVRFTYRHPQTGERRPVDVWVDQSTGEVVGGYY